MNKSYRIVWNKARNCLMVVAEFATSQGKGKSVGGAVIGAVAAAVMALGATGDAEATSSNTQQIVSGGSNFSVSQSEAVTVTGATAVWGTGSVGSISVTGTITGQPAGISIGGTPTNFSFGSNIEIGVMSTGPATTYTGTVSGSQTGISLRTTYLNSGSIINKGLINGSGVVGVLVSGSTIVGSILNQTQAATAGYPAAAGTIRGATGVLITNGSTVSPVSSTISGISNAGLIQGTSLAGVSIAGSQVNTIINQTGGTISGQWGLKITDAATITGDISNAGALVGSADTGSAALLLNASTITGNVFSSGRMFGQGAVQLINAQITGAFTNTGSIDSQGAPVAGDAINLQASNILGGLNNTGLIRGAQSGIQLVGSSIAGGFNNSGQIQGNAGAAVAMTNSTLSGGFTSSGTITGLSGIRLVNNATAVAVTNTGVIAATATSGSAVSVSGGQLVTLANVAGTVIGALNGNMDVSNSGLIALQQASGTNTVTGSHVNATISGNYYQAAAGMLQIGVTGTTGTGTTSGNFSILNVAGSATFAANSKLRVNLNQAGAVVIGQTITGVVAASSLSTNGFTITDNLAGINFTYTTTTGSLSLVAIASTVNCGATVSGNNLGTCEVAINNPNIYIDTTGKVGTNTGTINSMGIAVLSGNIAGRIYNRGTIVGGTSAIHFTSGATLTGGLTNAGLINGVTGTGISMAASVLGGGLTNQSGSTIRGALSGIGLNQGIVTGGLNNSGLISSDYVAINANAATISGGLNNSVGGVISGTRAISAVNSAISGGVNNSGFIVGIGNSGLAINASGNTIILNNAQYGQVYGGLQGTLDISNSGVIALQSVSGLSMVAGSHFNGSITGNFVESGTGALILGVAGSAGTGTTAGNFSVLTVDGTATLAAGSKVKIDLSSTTAILDGQTISNLITAAGGLTDNGVQIIGNSAKLDFTAITTAGGLSAAATQRSAASYSSTVTGAQTVTSYVAFDNANLTVSSTISGVSQGIVVLSAGPTAVERIYNNNGRILANQTGIYLSSGATVTAGITNAGVISGASNYGIYLNAALLQGGLTNSNFITSAGSAGVALVHSSLSGGINNSSTIQGGSTGIRLSASTLVGGLVNSGLINGATHAGVALLASTLGGGLTNNIGKQINGYTAGVRIASGSTVSGAINNSGVMSGGTASGAGFVLSQAYLASGLSNNAAGVISGRTGVRLANGSAINGPSQSAFTNSGAIRGTSGAAISVTGSVALYYNSTITGEFINQGTLSGQTGMAFNNATLTGAVTNNGFIQATAAGILLSGSTLNNGLNTIGSISAQTGLRLVNSTVAGVLRNTGTIAATNAAMSISGGISANITNTGMLSGQTGINIASAVLNGSLTNTGLITATGSAMIVSASTLAGTVFNGANGTLSGQTGLRVANSAINGAISNTGLITGAGAGLSIVGTVDVSGGFVNAGGTITGTSSAISLSNATMTGANGFTNQGLVYADSNNAITASGGTNTTIINATGGTIIGAFNGALNISNSGVVSLTSYGGTIGSHVSASIAGNYVQGTNALLVMGVDGVSGSGTLGGNFSTLAAGGVVNLNNSVINVQQNRGNAVLQGQTLASFITGSSVATNNLTIVDNIKSIYYTFTGTGGVFSLVAVASGADCGPTLSGASGPCQVTVPNPDLYIASTGQISSTIQGLYIISAAGSAEGRVLNAGTISANQTGVFFTSGANLAGGFTNTGLISGGNGYGILMTASGMGGFANLGGTVVGNLQVSYSTISGGVTNTGLMDGVAFGVLSGSGSAGYTIGGNSGLNGSFVNNGSITGNVVFAGSTLAGSWFSDGSITGSLTAVQSEITGAINNVGYIEGEKAIALYSATVGGGVTNSGLIGNNSLEGIQIGGGTFQYSARSGSHIVGSVVNTGTVNSIYSLLVRGSTITGDLANYGQLGMGGLGIGIKSSEIIGQFLNEGIVSGGDPAALEIANSMVLSGIRNNATGVFNGRSSIAQSTVLNGITNAGSFNGGLNVDQSTISSGINNTGFIAGLKLGYYSTAFAQQTAGTISGGVVNSGLIQAYAVALMVNGATITGGLTNTGSISTQYSSNANALQIRNSTLLGGFANSGIISGTSYGGGGASILNTTLVGGITNSGQILGTGSLAALTLNGATIAGGFNNTVGTIVGKTGIKLTNATITGGFNNGGLISGLNGVAMVATGLPSALSVQNAQSGLIVGAVTGDLEVSNSGVLALQTLSGIGGSIVAGSHVNATVAGNYIQSGTGALRIGATGATAGSYSQMTVGGIASFASGGQIVVNTNNLQAFNGGDTLSVVSVSGASALTVSGLSIVDNTPYVSFDWATAGGLLSLVAYSTAACGSVTGNIIASCEVSTINGGTAASDYTFVNVFSGGTISPNTASSRVYAPAISVISGAAVNGYINNAGLVLSNNTGILFNSGSNLQGGVTNTGLVIGTVAAGFAMTAGILQGGLSNAGGTFSGGQSGFNLVNASIAGGVTNTGLIQGLSTAGVAMYSTVVDSFRNTGGTIVGNNTGLLLSNSTITGGLSNTGLIQGSVAGVLLGAGTNVTLSNLASGSIVGVSGAGVSVTGATSSTINNLGYISSVNNAGSLNSLNNSGTLGGLVQAAGTLSGVTNSGLMNGATAVGVTGGLLSSLNNTGSITGSSVGVAIASAGTLSGLSNQASINSINNAGLLTTLANSGSLASLVNSGSVSTLTNTASLTTLANTGTIAAVNNTGGTITGLTSSGAITAVNNSGQISGINLGTNSQVANGITNAGLIGGAAVAITASGSTVTLINQAAGTVVGAINGSVNVSNSGLIALQSAYNGTTYAGSPVSSTITGNYVQAASGTLQLGVTSSGAGSGTTSGNYSNLGVGGSATFAGNSNINVIMSAANSVIAGQTLAGVVSATGGLSSAGFSIIDNSTLIDFVWRTTSGALMLVAITPSVTCAATITGAQQGACEVGLGLPNLTINALGTISGASQGIKVLSATSTAIMNLGSVIGSVSAIQFLTNGTLTGGITNAGLISGASGIVLGAGAYAQSITNNAGGSIVGSAGAGISVAGTATVGQIQNSGYISSINNAGTIGSSASAVMVGATGIVGSLANTGVITTSGTTVAAVSISGRLAGNVSNAGLVSASQSALRMVGGTVAGNLVNTGTIQSLGSNADQGAIKLSSAVITGNVTNTGVISAVRHAFLIGNSSTISGVLINQGSIVGVGTGLNIGGGSYISQITNTGYISSLYNSGRVGSITMDAGLVNEFGNWGGSVVSNNVGVRLTNGAVVNNFSNAYSGTITGLTQSGVLLGNQSTITGYLSNSNLISGGQFGIQVSSGSLIDGSLTNTGVIQATTFSGLYIASSSVSGNVMNQSGGSITGAYALSVNDSTIGGLINNSGAMVGTTSGVEFTLANVAGGFTNSGVVRGTNSIGLALSRSILAGGVTNLAGGSITGGSYGVVVSGGTVAGLTTTSITNQGYISGTTDAALALVAGSLTGNIVNAAGATISSSAAAILISNTINGATGISSNPFLLTGSIINNGLVTGATAVVVQNSTVTGSLSNAGMIHGASGVAITASGATLTVNNVAAGTVVGAINGNLDVSNSGLIALQSAYNGSTFAGSPVSATITGNYVQAASGTLQLGVTSSGAGTGTTSGNYSTLSLTGSASFAASSAINVVMSSADSVVAGQTLAGVVSAGSLTSNGFSILDNSALIGFRYQTVSGVLNLVAFNTPNCGSVVGTAQVGPCEVGVGIPSLTVTGLGTISGGTQGINVLAANLTGRIINQGTVQGTATAIRFVAGGTLSAGITNSGLIEGLGFSGVVINGASIGGIANNSGTIVAAGRGIDAFSGAVISGGITNTGLIANTSATVTGAAAVVFDAATLVGGLLNTGNITSSGSALQLANSAQLQGGLTNTGSLIGGGNAGLYITGFSTLSGLVNNSGYFAGISLKSSGLIANGINNAGVVSLATAISIANNSTIAGGIVNSGTIHGNGNFGISLGRTSALVGGVNNLAGGTISGAMTAISLSRYSVVSAITNSGLIAGNNAFGTAISISRSTITDGIANTGSIVSAGSYAVTIDAQSSVIGRLANNGGYVSGVNNAGYLGGVSNSSGLIAGGINNTGTIARDSLAVFMYHGTLTGGFTNSGVIQATSSFAGMQLYATSLTGNLSNLGGTILGGLGGSAALSLISGSLVTGVLTNSGMIFGQVGVELYASQVAGGITNSGSIVGTSGAGVEVGANTTLSGLNNTGYISSVSNAGFIATINNVGGTIAGGVTNAGLIYNASGSSITASGSTLTVANIAGGTLVGAFGGDMSISNSGLVALQTMAGGTISAGTSLSASITGNYVQATAGTLQFGVNGLSGTGTIAGNYSTLTVSGSATFAANSKLKVSMSSTTAVQNGQTLAGVLTAGSLTTNGFSITDNSALVDFSYATVGGVLSLIATAPVTVACGTVSSSVQGPCLMAFNAPNVLVTGLGTISGGSTGIRVLSGSIVGGIVNQGSVIGTSYGVGVTQGATTITGSLSNAGLIQGGVAGVYLSNTSLSGGLSNASAGTISGVTGLSVLAGSLLAGGLTNSGLITGAGSNAHGVNLAGNLAGGLNNAGGTISGALIGINQVGGTLAGGLSNTGVITGVTGAGMFLGAANLQGGLSNLGGSITGGNTGVLVSASTIAGAFSNTGLIQGLTTAGLSLAAGSTLSGVLNNATSGTITGSTGLQVVSSSLASGLTNAGLITGTTAAGVSLSNAIVGGSIINNGGTMTGAQNGLAIYNGTTVLGNVSNSGYLQATTYAGLSLGQSYITGSVINQSGASITGYYGLNANGATVGGGMTNAGLVQGTYSGLSLVNANVTNGVNNLSGGSITGGTLGVYISGTQLSGGLNNASNATISGGVTGLSVSANSTVTGGLTNAGLITGGTYAINAPGLTSIVSTGTASQFVGTVSASSATLSVANGSTLTAGSPMVLGSVNVANGAQMNLTSSPTATVSGGVAVTNGFTNAGVLNVGQSAATITGNYAQTSLGNLFVPVVGSSGSGTAAGAYGQLHVTGAANFAANTTITVSMNAQNSVLGGGTLAGVVTAGTLTTNGFTIVDNSALVNFVWSTVGGTLSLIAVANGNVCGATISGAQAGPCQVAYNNPNLTVTSLGSITGGAQGTQVLSGLVTGHIANQGLISGSQTGVQFAVGSTLSGGLTNSGLITGTSLAGVVMSGTLLQGGLNNLGGSITGGVTGLQMAGSTIAGGISNTGYIQGQSAAGVALVASQITGNLHNAGGTIAGGVTGLSVSANSVVTAGLTNAGLITGGSYAVNAPGLTSIVATGPNSQFVGTVSAANATLQVASGATMTAAQGISVSALVVGTGSTLNLVSSSTATTSGGVSVTSGMTNAGVVNVGQSVATITGNYSQGSTGSLAFAGNGRLMVTGVANFGANTQIQAPTTAFTTSSFLNGNSTTVITVAGTLLSNGFNVTGGTPVIGYQAVTNGNSVNLVAQANNLQTIVSSQGNTAGMGAAGALNSVLTGFVNGASNAMTPVAATFANMSSNAQVSQAVSQSLPVLSSNSPVQTLAVLTAINQSIEARSLKLRGVSSGHEMYGNNNVWMKPFGSWMNQGNMNGAYGFKANAGGLMLGADHQWDDKARVGGAFAWGNSSANSNMGGQNQTSNMYQFVAYGAYAVTPSVNVNMQANGGWNNNTTNRNIGFLGTSAQASYDSAVWHAGVGVDRPTKLSEDTTFIPQARFDYTWIRNQGYSETGAAYGMGLNVGSQTYQTSVLGVDGKVQHKIGDHHMVSTNLGVGYNFSPTQTWVAASYQGASALQFTTTGVNPSALSGRAGLGYTYKVKEGVDVGVRYDIDVQEQYTNQIATAKARWNF